MWTAIARAIFKEFCTTLGHVPFVLRALPDFNSTAAYLAVHYLRWRIGKMHPIDIQVMIETGLTSIEDLDRFAAETS